MKLVNLTPHPVTLTEPTASPSWGSVTIPPDPGGPARVAVHDAVTAWLSLPGRCQSGGAPRDHEFQIPVKALTWGEVEGLPGPREGVLYIVSRLVADAAPDRDDLVVPHDVKRDDAGAITHCEGLALATGCQWPEDKPWG